MEGIRGRIRGRVEGCKGGQEEGVYERHLCNFNLFKIAPGFFATGRPENVVEAECQGAEQITHVFNLRPEGNECQQHIPNECDEKHQHEPYSVSPSFLQGVENIATFAFSLAIFNMRTKMIIKFKEDRRW